MEREESAPPSAPSRRGAAPGWRSPGSSPSCSPRRPRRSAPRRITSNATSAISSRSRPRSPRTVERFGGIDVVLANAGIGTYGTAEKGDPQAWLRTVDVNLNGVYRTLHATLPHVLERRGYIGVVCSIASFAPLAGMSSYSAAKAGAESLVRAVRQEVGFRGVDVGAIHPSWIDTDMVRESERDLPSFREGREKLPWPLKATTSVEACAKAIVDGFERRKARVFVPRAAVLAYWLRTLITSGAGERTAGGDADERIPRLEREIAALGRPASARTAAISDLSEDGDAATAAKEEPAGR